MIDLGIVEASGLLAVKPLFKALYDKKVSVFSQSALNEFMGLGSF